jgi:carbon monoxide dehydrogenase subunit G
MNEYVAIGLVAAAVAAGASIDAVQSRDVHPWYGAKSREVNEGDHRNYEVAGFEKVSSAGPQNVVISVGPAASVRAEGPRETLDLLEVVVKHGSLEIRPKHEWGWNYRWPATGSATFYVTLPQLSAVSQAGSGEMKIDNVETDDFKASVAGSGQMEIAMLAADDAKFSIAGSGDLTARGRARRSELSIAGSGSAKMHDVASETAKISIAGSGEAELTVQGNASVSIVGSGDVDIAGPANCSVSRMGGGHVRCGGEER